MTRAEYKQALAEWKRVRGEGILEHIAQTLAAKIREYEWAHGLRYVVWAVKWHWGDDVIGPDMLRVANRKHAFDKASHVRSNGGLRVRITRAVRKPKGSP